MSNYYLEQYKYSGIPELLPYYPAIEKVFGQYKKLDKEITEAFAVLNVLNPLIRKHEKTKDIAIIDIGCGKGFFAMMASWIFDRSQIFAVDFNPNLDSNHFQYFENIEFMKSNVMTTEFEDFINNLDYDMIIIVGIHSCRELGKRVVELYDITKANHMVMMPCCTGKEAYIGEIYGNGIEHYQAWCNFLYKKILPDEKLMFIDSEILSPRNNIILSSKL